MKSFNSKRKKTDLLRRANQLYGKADFDAAEKCCKGLLGDIDAVGLLGKINYHKRNLKISIELLYEYLSKKKEDPDCFLLLGNSLQESGRYEESIEIFTELINRFGDFATAWSNLGNSYLKVQGFGEAENAFTRALQIDPNHPFAALGMGNLCVRAKKVDEAIGFYKLASASAPGIPKILASLASAYGQKRDRGCFRIIEELRSRIDELSSYEVNVIYSLCKQICYFEPIKEIWQKLERSGGHDLEEGPSGLLYLNGSSDVSREELFRLHCQWGSAISRIVPDKRNAGIRKSKKLKIGFLSGDFKNHSVGFFIRNVIPNLDQSCFDVYCYYNDSTYDSITHEIANSSYSFQEVKSLSDAELSSLIRKDGVQVLIDLSGHTSGTRLSVMAHKPAPIQITYLGYPNTTGLESVDFRITDKFAESDGKYYSEELLYMPESFLCFGGFEESEFPDNTPAEKNGYITFGSFNNISKFTPDVIRVWSAVLKKVPNSRLLIKSYFWLEHEEVENRIRDYFEKNGIPSNRIIMISRVNATGAHRKLYNSMDIALDTFPYNGTTTTCEALWMGVPVLTLVGDSHAQRVGNSILSNIGFEEGIARSEEDFVCKAVRLASDFQKLTETRKAIRRQIRASILCDPKRFAAQFGDLLLEAVEKKIPDFRISHHSNKCERKSKDDYLKFTLADDFKIYVPDSSSQITPYVLMEQGDWFEGEIHFTRKYLQSGMNVVDIGANFGIYTPSAASRVGENGWVWAFEPTETTADSLEMSIEENRFDHVQLLRSALSDKEGEAFFSLGASPELNQIVEKAEGRRNVVKVPVSTLDHFWCQVNGRSVDLLKLDAEGKEIPIIQGGRKFFDHQSPLVMYEIKHGNRLNHQLHGAFEEIGYDSYQLIPGLGFLVPFSPKDEIDPFLLNLFCCKKDRASQLSEQGLLVPAEEIEGNQPNLQQIHWVDILHSTAHGRLLLESWESFIIEAAKDPAWMLHQKALNCYTASVFSPRASERYLALQQSFKILSELIRRMPTLSRLLSFVRVSTELGQRGAAVRVLKKMIEAFEAGTEMHLDEPFLALSSYWDTVEPDGRLGEWCLASILEMREKLQEYSSFFRSPELESHVIFESLGFPHTEMARRKELAEIRLGLKSRSEFRDMMSEISEKPSAQLKKN